MGVGQRPHGGRSRAAIEEGELAEVVAGVQLGEGVPAAFDCRLALSDHVELMARLALRAHHVSGCHVAWFHHEGDAVELGWQEAGEQRHVTHESLELGRVGHRPNVAFLADRGGASGSGPAANHDAWRRRHQDDP